MSSTSPIPVSPTLLVRMDGIETVWNEVDRLVVEAGLTDVVEWVHGLGLPETLRWFDEWWDSPESSDKQRRVMLLVVFGGTLIDGLHLQTTKWVVRFRQVGFISDLPGQLPPATELVVFRGAPKGWERGMSWSSSIETARRFAAKYTEYGPEPGFVWRAIAAPGSVLALIYQRDESEVVVDPTGLNSVGKVPAT